MIHRPAPGLLCLSLALLLAACDVGLSTEEPILFVDDDDPEGDDDDDADDDDGAPDDDDATDDDDIAPDDDDGSPDDVCDPQPGAGCDWSIDGDTSSDGDATQAFSVYPCSGWDATGPELSWAFTATGTGQVTATLSDIEDGQDLDVYVLAETGAGCDADDCLGYGNTEATFDVTSGNTYYLVVDGYEGAAGSFTLDVTCGFIPGDDDDAADDDDIAPDDDDIAPDDDDIAPDDDDFVPPPEDCADGVDNDGDGLADCEDPDCAADPACSSPGVCSPDYALTEGGSDSWGNGDAGSTNAIDLYGCIDWDESGPEYTYSYTAAIDGQVTVEIEEQADSLLEILFGVSDDLDVFVLDGTGACDGAACVTYGDSDVTWDVTVGSQWFIVVDGFMGDVSPYELELTGAAAPTTETVCDDGLDDEGDGLIDCDDPDCASAVACAGECVAGLELFCGDSDSHANDGAGSTDNIDEYSCTTWGEDGPEYTYLFQPTSDATVEVSLSGMSDDLDLFAIEDVGGFCDSDQCTEYGDNSMTFSATAGSIYYIVVDGYLGSTSSYDITLTCN